MEIQKPLPLSPTLLEILQSEFRMMRASLLRARRESRSFISETHWIREADWKSRGVGQSSSRSRIVVDLERDFVPTPRAWEDLDRKLCASVFKDEEILVYLRGLEFEDVDFLTLGHASPSVFQDLAFVLERNPRAILGLSRVTGYHEARFWSDVLRRVGQELRVPDLRVEVALDHPRTWSECEEIAFELKDFLVGIHWDPRWEEFWELRGEIVSISSESWKKMAHRRGLEFRTAPESAMPVLDLRQQVEQALRYLEFWYSDSTADSPLGDGFDFELLRSRVWRALRDSKLKLSQYQAWKNEWCSPSFSGHSLQALAIRTLDTLVLREQFEDSSWPIRGAILKESIKTQSVNPLKRVESIE